MTHIGGTERRPFWSKGQTPFVIYALLSVSLLTVLVPRPSKAQVLYGTLLGNVSDSSGLPISGATVVATNAETNSEKTATTDSSGGYRFSDLEEGTYTVSATAPSFGKVISQGIAIRTNTEGRFDPQLQPATVGQTVIVTSAPPELQTDSGTVTAELEKTQVQTLVTTPGANMRNFQSLYVVLPGFTPPGASHSESGNPGDTLVTNVNGVSQSNNNTRIDGVSDIYPWLPEIAAYTPSVEAISAVNAVTNSFDAEQGLAAGTVINVSTRSGTNSYHGTAWEYNLNNALEAKGYFVPANTRTPKYILNQFGANYGGPIRKNKAFFFANWERSRRAQAVSGFQTIPTQAMVNGDFQGISTTIYDPLTGNPDGTGRTPFPNNIIPASRIAFAAKQLAALLPVPNITTNSLFNNYFVAADAEYTRDNVDSRVDWSPTTKSTIFGRYGFQNTVLFDPQPLGGAGGNTLDGGQPGNAPSLIQSVGMGGTYSFTPNLLLDGNLGFLRQGLAGKNTDIGTNFGLTLLDIPGTNGTAPLDGGFPAFNLSNLSSLGNPNRSNPFTFNDNTYTTAMNLSWNLKRHSTRYGFEFQHYAINHFQPQNTAGPRGGFTFSGGLTALKGGAAPNGFNSWADFLLGLPQEVQKDTQFLNPSTLRENVWAFYARDQWQVTDKITLTFGLRYEYYPIATRDHTGLDIFNPVNGLIDVGGVNGIPENAGVNVGRGNFAPRAGLAYRIDSKTVARVGYGISVNPDNFRNVLTGYPTVLSQTFQGNTPYIAGGSLAAGIPAVATPNLSSGSIQLPSTLSTTTLPLNYRRGYYESYNAALERQLPAAITLQATYVGTLIIREVPGININPAPPGGGVAGEVLNKSLGISAAETSEIPIGTGHYNGLQAQAKRRFSGDSNVGITYTYSRSINDYGDNSDGASSLLVSYLPDYFRNKGVAGFDRTHNFEAFGNYELPFGRDKAFLPRGVAGYVLEGWGLTGSLSRLSGTPFTVSGSGASLNAPGNSQFADQLVQHVQILGGHSSTQPYFNPADFADPSVAIAATGGSARFGTAGRNSVRGPGFFNLSTSLSRTFPITERLNAVFRAEAFNLTNTPSFANPAANVSSQSGSALNGFSTISSTANNSRELRLSARFNF
jgi:hypothetical protein